MSEPTDFQEWLHARGIDCESLTAELKTALLCQWTNERMAAQPPSVVLVLPADCLWPMRTYRVDAK